jgi:uncharacterized membrane protein YhaH (DUF805 family)
MTDMTPIDWAIRPMQRYADFAGRAPRAEYWWFYLATIVVGLIAGAIDGIAGNTDVGWLGGIVNLALLIPTIAVTVRRLHDTDRSGWWLVLGIVLIVGLVAVGVAGAMGSGSDFPPVLIVAVLVAVVVGITLFVFMVLPGTDGPNSYGPDPYGPDQLEEIFA